MQRVLRRDDVALLVDDWAEQGSQAAAVRQLVIGCHATFAGASLLVDQMDDSARARLGRVTSLVRVSELGDSGGAEHASRNDPKTDAPIGRQAVLSQSR
jgi:adenine phosphoribosyltransferase